MASLGPVPRLAPPSFSTRRSIGTSATSTATATTTSATTPSSTYASASSFSSSARKRARHESPSRDWHDLGASTWSAYGDPSPGFFPMGDGHGSSPVLYTPGATSHGFFSPGLASPTPLTHSRYQLAGGQATPPMTRSATSDCFSDGISGSASTSDLSFRRGRPYHDEHSRSTSSFAATQLSSQERLPTALARESNGQPRALCNPDASATLDGGLTRSVLQTVSGVVGRVWNFCTVGTFRGFFAGGGPGYTLDSGDPGGSQNGPADHTYSSLDGGRSIWHDMGASSCAIPGGFPSPPSTPDMPPAPAAKKAKRAHDLHQSWVVVREASPGPGASAASVRSTPPPSPHRKPPASTASPASMRHSPASSVSLGRPQLRRSGASTQTANAVHGRTASAAGLRSPGHARHGSLGGANRPALGHARRSSAGANSPPQARSRRSSEMSVTGDSASPLAAETARFVKQVRRAERREDRDLRRMNATLEDMIREAREALGTTVEVEMLGEGREEDLW